MHGHCFRGAHHPALLQRRSRCTNSRRAPCPHHSTHPPCRWRLMCHIRHRHHVLHRMHPGATARHGPGDGVRMSAALGDADVVVAAFDTSGNYRWHRTLGSTGNDRMVNTIANTGKLYVHCSFAAAPVIAHGSHSVPLPVPAAESIATFDSTGALLWIARCRISRPTLPLAGPFLLFSEGHTFTTPNARQTTPAPSCCGCRSVRRGSAGNRPPCGGARP